MDVQTISERSYSIYITEGELNRRSISPQAVTAGDVMELIKDLTGALPAGSTKLELYPGRHELLIFVRRNPGALRCFRFRALEDLISAALTSGGEEPSALYLYDDTYILAVWDTEDTGLAALCEFGESLDWRDAHLAHLREHGKLLLPAQALRELRAAFRPEQA